MTHFHIPPLDSSIRVTLTHKINQKTKPLGALGYLEKIALKVGLIQESLHPQLRRPVALVFAGDHGIATAGVSPYPQAVTGQMVQNFLNGGAAINVFAKQHGFVLRVIDSGVNAHFAPHADLINVKIGMGTESFLTSPAMTEMQCKRALTTGQALAVQEIAMGSNVMAFGEMGIGNTSSASCLMSVLTDLPIQACVGRGTGLDDAGLAKKTYLLNQALHYHALIQPSPLQALATFGGFEIAMMVGAMLAAAQHKAILLIDGFIATAALLVASKMQPTILDYCIFGHCSDEHAHRALLEYLQAEPLLDIRLRLGEGTGAVLAYPLLVSAVNFLNDMASFAEAGVSVKEDT